MRVNRLVTSSECAPRRDGLFTYTSPDCVSLCKFAIGTPGTIRELWGSENAKIHQFSVTPPHNVEKL